MIGKKLKEYRQTLKVTGETLANLAGIKRSYLSQIENEKKVPPIDTFINIVNSISKISPINDENVNDVLTEEMYQEFKSLLKITLFHNSPNDSDFDKDKRVVENVMVDAYMIDGGNIDIGFDLDKKRVELVTSKDIDSILKPLFFDGYKMDSYNFNIANDDYSDVIAYQIPEVRENLFKWWYNYILQDIIKTGIKDNVIYADKEINEIDMPLSNYDTNLSEADRKLLAELWPLMDENGQFTPYNDDDSINISKDLLNGKTVTFDIRSITDKNVRALLDGQLLSNDELTAIKFTLNGIRYNREQNRK